MTHKMTRHNGSAIRDFRLCRGMTVDELAQKISISAPHMRNIENELREASPLYLHRLADVLGVRPTSLVRDRTALTGEQASA